MKIEDAIKQSKFRDEFEKADINLLFTANWMNSEMHRQLKPYDISQQQFNILRILRGQKGNPAPLKLITERMMDKMSNTSRLVDKMYLKGLLNRQTCADNRRQVEIKLTEAGLKVCNQVSDMVDQNRIKNRRLDEDEAAELNRLLDKMRS
ncbi:MAG: MarR family transcriptional regulator [Vicingaceae bacterium]